VVDVQSYRPSWHVIFFVFIAAEVFNLLFSSLFFLTLWRPTRRGARCATRQQQPRSETQPARFLDNLNPPFPESDWPEIDVFICHYTEAAEDTLATLDAAMSLEYPKDKLHIWVCDDGYCLSNFKVCSWAVCASATDGFPRARVCVRWGVRIPP
jgi:cellulose synthase (UDP-forming)